MTNKQIALDQAQRKRVDDAKQVEKLAAEAEVYATLNQLDKETAKKLSSEQAPEPEASVPGREKSKPKKAAKPEAEWKSGLIEEVFVRCPRLKYVRTLDS